MPTSGTKTPRGSRFPVRLVAAILLVTLLAGGLVAYLVRAAGSRGAVLVEVPEIQGATVRALRGGREIASAPVEGGRARLRVPRDADLVVQVSAPGYRTFEDPVRLKPDQSELPVQAKLDRLTGKLQVTLEAPGLKGPARLVLKAGQTPPREELLQPGKTASFEVPWGQGLTLEASAPGFVKGTGTVTVDPATLSATLPLKLVPNRGTLEVVLKGERLGDAQAEVRVVDSAGKELARTQASSGTASLDVPAGQPLTLKVTSALHMPDTKTATLAKAGDKATVELSLALAPRLKLQTRPAATVLVDGKEVGPADASGSLTLTEKFLTPGRQYRIEARKDGYKPASKEIEARGGETPLALNLEALPAPPREVPRSEPGPASQAPAPRYDPAPAPRYAPPPAPAPPPPAPAPGGSWGPVQGDN